METQKSSSGVVTGIIMVLIFVAGYALGYFTAPSASSNGVTSVTSSSAGESTSADSDVTTPQPSEISEPTTIDSSQMTDGQKALLRTMGLDPESITITPEMVACAEAEIGADRVAAIQNGDTPGPIEGAKMLACYNGG